jgi:iron complex transport system ATP-binding protein
MSALLTVQNLTFSYPGVPTLPIFREVSFSVDASNVFCLLGPNGTGKSTLLKCVANVLQGWHGTILLGDKNISHLRPAEVAKGIAYVPQNQVSAFPFLVHDVVVMGRAPHLSIFSSPTRSDREIAYNAMKTVGILHLAERPCTMLSGGEWQLTLIARAMAQEPRVMILDEPTSHLDMGNQVRILRVIRSLAKKGLAIVMASHFPDHAFIAATEAAILDDGRMIRKGPPDEIITAENLGKAYGIEVKVLQVGEGVNRKACFPSLNDFTAGTSGPKPGKMFIHVPDSEGD